jgi:hypothetical protein
MTEDRMMVASAVVDGLISEEYLTMSEINEMIEMLSDLSISQGLEDARARGCIVFDCLDFDSVH